MQPDILVILGPTASGKTHLACMAAKELNGEIISADSRQIYKHMDIGTGKDLEEYTVEGVEIPHHLIDIREPGYKYNIAEYQEDFLRAMKDIQERGKFPILCGGSGLYIETALSGNSFLGIPSESDFWDEMSNLSDNEVEQKYETLPTELKQKLTASTRKRKLRAIEIHRFLEVHPDWKPMEIPTFTYKIVGVKIDRETRRKKITQRLSYRMNHGLIEEVQFLLDNYLTHEDLEYYGLEYKWVGRYLRKEITKKELFEGLNIAIHQFAKRQMTWFRKMEREGYEIEWIDAGMEERTKLEELFMLMG